jgi:hypothetical protein
LQSVAREDLSAAAFQIRREYKKPAHLFGCAG